MFGTLKPLQGSVRVSGMKQCSFSADFSIKRFKTLDLVCLRSFVTFQSGRNNKPIFSSAVFEENDEVLS